MINEITLEGRIVAKPELTRTQAGKELTKFTIANPRTSEKTEFIDCVCWNRDENGNLATYIASNTDKGTLVVVKGRIQKDKNQMATGQVYYNCYILVDSLQIEN